jgi:dihydropteroate synthase
MEEKAFPKIMGILNITPDSFSDGGLYISTKKAIDHSLELIDSGADIIDIGGESSRPGSVPVSTEDEINRVVPIIKEIKKLRTDTIISIDTYKYEVAKESFYNGATIINDITALRNDERMAELISENNLTVILMHMKGTPQTMQIDPIYSDVVSEVFDFLQKRVIFAKRYGINSIIIDVGIGFGKTVENNLELLKNLAFFSKLNVPQLLGISRKAFIGKLLEIDKPSERDAATALIHSLLLNSPVDFIRIHNVKLLNILKKLKIFLNF